MSETLQYSSRDPDVTQKLFEMFERIKRESRGWFERFLDGIFERFITKKKIDQHLMLIREGCESDPLSTKDPVYMKRWFLWGSRYETRLGFRIMLHKIMMSDNDRELHDHPWSFISIILKGGYDEETETLTQISDAAGYLRLHEGLEKKRKYPGMVLIRPSEHRHRVQLINGATNWSLVFTTGKKRSWGFWRKNEFIPHGEFVRQKCMKDQKATRA